MAIQQCPVCNSVMYYDNASDGVFVICSLQGCNTKIVNIHRQQRKTREEKFEYSVGNLDGNGSAGSGWGGAWTNVNGTLKITSTSPAEGDACVIAEASTNVGTNNSYRDVTDITSGIFYVSLKTKYNADGSTAFGVLVYGNNGATLINRIFFDTDSSGREIQVRDASTQTDIGEYIDDTWVRIGIEFDCSTDQVRFNVDDGTWTSWYDFENSTNELDRLRLWAASLDEDSYIDYISPNYSDTPAATAEDANFFGCNF